MDSSITTYLGKSITKKGKVLSIPKGPQFNMKGGAILAMVALMLLIFSIACLAHAYFLYAIFFVISGIMVLSIAIDIHGIEVDTSTHTIRDYRAFLWFRIGKWSNINDFKSIYLTKKYVTIKISGIADNQSDTFHYYRINLVDELNNKEIFLAEYKNYYKAEKISKSIANATGLEFKDFLKRGKKFR